MGNFDYKKYLAEGKLLEAKECKCGKGKICKCDGKSLLKENAPGYDSRKFGEALPTLESVKAAYEAKGEGYKEYEDDVEKEKLAKAGDLEENEDSFGDAGTDKRSGQVIGDILQLIRDTGIDPADVLEEIGQEFGIAFEFGRG